MTATRGDTGDHEPDRRVRRTRRQLHLALVELATELGYDQVTVEHLTNRADLARRTFYAHYVDKDSLLEAVVGALMTELVGRLDAAVLDDDRPVARSAAIRELFLHGEENRDCYRMLLAGAGNGRGLRKMSNTLSAHFEQHMVVVTGRLGLTPELPLDFVARAFVGQHLTILRWWLDNQVDYTVDQLAAMRAAIMEHGELWAMGFPVPVA